MEIYVVQLKEKVNKWNSLLEKQEELHNNIYYVMASFSSLWQDPIATKFIDQMQQNKVEEKQFLDILKEEKNIYDHFIEQYEKIGKKIRIELEEKAAMLSKMNAYLEELRALKAQYKALDISFLDGERKILKKEEEQVNACITQVELAKNRIKEKIDTIEEIEKTMFHDLAGIHVPIIKENDLERYNG